MLIEKKVAVGDTISFRLITGEEIIAKLTDINETAITVSKPIVAQMQMVGPNQAALAFGPFMMTADEEATKFTFRRDRLLSDPIKPRKDIAANYIQATTGIVPAAAGGLITK